jgi:hypothetical protein
MRCATRAGDTDAADTKAYEAKIFGRRRDFPRDLLLRGDCNQWKGFSRERLLLTAMAIGLLTTFTGTVNLTQEATQLGLIR